MARDDYFVIAYRLLKYLYDCLKKGNKPNNEVLDSDFFKIGEDYWCYILNNLFEDGYITGISSFNVLGVYEKRVKILPTLKITPKGIQYLEENTLFQKIKGTVKDIADIIPI